jgi:zinc transporter ZupT
LRRRLVALLPVGMVMGMTPWVFYAPAVAYSLYFPSQRGDTLPLLLAGVAASCTLIASCVLLTDSRDDPVDRHGMR